MLTSLTLQKNTEFVKRDPLVPLTRVTLLCGPNGSGKSTFIDALGQLLDPRQSWTRHTAPVLPAGTAQCIGVICLERDNLRMAQDRDMPMNPSVDVLASRLTAIMDAKEQSHGQSNYDILTRAFQRPDNDVLVLDEPESALDLDGLLWLREQLQTTSKQVILATHSVVLLSLQGTPDVSLQVFGPETDYPERVLASYLALTQGKRLPASKKRMPK